MGKKEESVVVRTVDQITAISFGVCLGELAITYWPQTFTITSAFVTAVLCLTLYVCLIVGSDTD